MLWNKQDTNMARKLASKLTKKQGFDRLDMSIKLFTKGGFLGSIDQLKIIKNELKTTKNLKLLNNAFKVLQTSFIVEFNNMPNTNHSHRTQLSTFFKKRVNLTLKLNTIGLNKKSTDKQWGKLIKQRLESRIVITKLGAMLHEGHKTSQDRAIAGSYLYLSTIDGIYGKNLKDVVIWDLLSKIENVNMQKIHRMSLSDIIDYFKRIPKSDILFDGYNANIRNAIAHSSFTFNDRTEIITYEDRRKSRINKINIATLASYLEKFDSLNELVLIYNEIQTINKIIWDLR